MLTINLQQIVEEINGRRNRIKYQFQELGMMLATKLGDLGHRSLYMKLAKYEEQELLVDAMHYVLASPNVSGNMGALFMWKLKELKARPIHPVAIRFELEDGYFKIGMISNVTRGDMPLLVAGLTDFTEGLMNNELIIKEVKEKNIAVDTNPYLTLPLKLTELLKEFKRRCSITMYSQWQWSGVRLFQSGEIITGVLKLGVPVLTKRFPTGRMPTS